MRRALLLLGALAAPAVAAAQTVASGQILFTDGTDDLVHGPFISAAECQSTTAVVNLSWNTQVTSGSFPAAAKYTLYASNKQSTDTNCITSSNSGTGTFAGSIGATLTGFGQVVNLQPFPTSAFVTVSGYTCSVAADTPIYVCVQAYQSDGVTVVGVAKGTLTLSTSIPGAPTGVTATPADTGALEISWTAPAGSPAAYDYRIVATAQTPADDPGSPHEATDVRALSYIMDGLVVGVTYDIAVYGRSQAGNEGPAGTTSATSVVVANFWDVYHDPPYGGRDSGGCAAGAAGPVALLGVAAVLARLRRRR